MLTFTVGDTSPNLAGKVNAELTGATAVVHIRQPNKTVLSKPATIFAAAEGGWMTEWEPGDLSMSGAHYVEVEVTFSNGVTQTFGTDRSGQLIWFMVRAEIL